MSERSTVLLLSGANLNLLGGREPEVYGTATLDDHVATARTEAERNGLALEHLQSNHEGELVEAIHAAHETAARPSSSTPAPSPTTPGPSTTRWPRSTGRSWSSTCPTPTPASRGATPR